MTDEGTGTIVGAAPVAAAVTSPPATEPVTVTTAPAPTGDVAVKTEPAKVEPVVVKTEPEKKTLSDEGQASVEANLAYLLRKPEAMEHFKSKMAEATGKEPNPEIVAMQQEVTSLRLENTRVKAQAQHSLSDADMRFVVGDTPEAITESATAFRAHLDGVTAAVETKKAEGTPLTPVKGFNPAARWDVPGLETTVDPEVGALAEREKFRKGGH